jgi:hypothetical protein
MPKAAHRTRAVGAERRGIDGAEPSSTIESVMAGHTVDIERCWRNA